MHSKTYLDKIYKMFTPGSMMSAVKCERCNDGYLLPRLPTVIGDIYSHQSFLFHIPSIFPLKDLPGGVVAAARLWVSQPFRAN